MALPFAPEPIEALRARYPAALETTHDVESIALGSALRPGEMRRHVFDFEDGLRLIVSREDVGTGSGAVLHVSASATGDGGAVVARIRAIVARRVARRASLAGLRDEVGRALVALAEAAFRELSGDPRPMRLLGFSEGAGIPHWVVEDGDDSPGE